MPAWLSDAAHTHRRVGFLYCVLFAERFMPGVLSMPKMCGRIVDTIIEAGRAKSRDSRCPLMYSWHHSRYAVANIDMVAHTRFTSLGVRHAVCAAVSPTHHATTASHSTHCPSPAPLPMPMTNAQCCCWQVHGRCPRPGGHLSHPAALSSECAGGQRYQGTVCDNRQLSHSRFPDACASPTPARFVQDTARAHQK